MFNKLKEYLRYLYEEFHNWVYHTKTYDLFLPDCPCCGGLGYLNDYPEPYYMGLICVVCGGKEKVWRYIVWIWNYNPDWL